MRLFHFAVLLVSVVIMLVTYAEMVTAEGWTEVEIQWKADETREEGSKVLVAHGFSWQGELGQLRLPIELELKWNKAPEAYPVLEKGQATLRLADYELRVFHDMGFRSTLDPMRLLSSSRRADAASGLELKGRLGPVSGRGLWLNAIDNIGDNGPLFALDMSLDGLDRAGKYRYVYLSHDSDWNWHFPKAGAYPTRTARQVHSLIGTWDLTAVRVSAQVATLMGFDVRKTYRRDLQGFAVLSRGQGRFPSADWSIDVYQSNAGFLLATGDSDSLGAGRQGLRARLTRNPHRDESFRIEVEHDRAVPELIGLQSEVPDHGVSVEPSSQVEVTYRRRRQVLSYRLGVEWKGGTMMQKPKILWETNWLPRKLQVGGYFGGIGSSQLYSRFPLFGQINGDVRYDLSTECWRTAVQLQGLDSSLFRDSRWQGEVVFKKRPGEAYTYVALEHKMKQGYWAIIWGKTDRGRLDWSWGETPLVSIRIGRYF